uniref:Uncharacterized protein n=1 Tax=Oryza sativa subsp. japonica TaxID=39947 RepID=Q6Z6H1_ORYSJ|nr:hypothetical protein [Oryza sativa Japonica Group]
MDLSLLSLELWQPMIASRAGRPLPSAFRQSGGVPRPAPRRRCRRRSSRRAAAAPPRRDNARRARGCLLPAELDPATAVLNPATAAVDAGDVGPARRALAVPAAGCRPPLLLTVR